MGLPSLLRGGAKLVKSVVKPALQTVSSAGKIPILGKALPYVGAAAAIADIGLNLKGKPASGGIAGGTKLPSIAGGLPPLPAMFGGTGGTGILPKGPGGKLQLPWNDPSVAQYLKAFAIDDQYLRPAFRSPPGYVTVRDANGRPYPLLKIIARKFGLWKPAHKPPISVRDWQALKRSGHTVKKLRKVHKLLAVVHHANHPHHGGKKGRK